MLALSGLLTLGSTAFAQTSQHADVPKTISYQGLLSPNNGDINIDGTYPITVTLYADSYGNSPVWKGTYSTTLHDGVFDITLGSGDFPLPDAPDMDRPLWAGISIDGGQEMRPLTALTSSPYAMNVADGAISAEKIADGAVTPEKLDMDYVSGVLVNGQKVTGRGTSLNLVGGGDIALRYDEASGSLRIESATNQGTGDKKGASTLAATGFDELTTATNTSATMTVGTGASLAPSGSGTVTANQFVGSGSTTTAVDLATSEVNGVLPVANGGTGSNVGAWLLQGNSGTNPDGGSPQDYLGTSDNNALNVRVNNIRIMRFQPNALGPGNIVGGYEGNTVSPYTNGSTIAGGGAMGAINNIDGGGAFIGSGQNNSIDVFGTSSIIGAGENNQTQASWTAIVSGQGNMIHSNSDWSIIGGGENNSMTEYVEHGFIGGGSNNQISSNYGDYGVIGGGDMNDNQGSSYSFIGAGSGNILQESSDYSVIGGGTGNVLEDYVQYGVIGGGDNNAIGTDSHYDVIGGGANNRIYGSNDPDHCVVTGGVIAGGTDNKIAAYSTLCGTGYSTVSGGQYNEALVPYSTIGGGLRNKIGTPSTSSGGENGVITGGLKNTLTGFAGVIGGGEENTSSGPHSIIGSGFHNTLTGTTAALVGGTYNVVGGDLAFLGGGDHNTADGSYSSLSGGTDNHAIGNYSTVGGGQTNSADADWSTVTGGQDNHASQNHAFAGGGKTNSASGNTSVVVGGTQNSASGIYSSIVGGHGNSVTFNGSIVGGGNANVINSQYSGILGGIANSINSGAGYSAIGGGGQNLITANGINAVIPGGDALTAQSFAQTVIGYYNIPRGSMASRPNATTTAASNDPVLIIGNGDYWNSKQSNAFEVSYNGHSTVFGGNGNTIGGGKTPIKGATYTDNVLYSWGNVMPGAPTPVVLADFGVTSVVNIVPGVYRVTIKVVDPITGDGLPLNGASVTATLIDQGPEELPMNCATISVGQIHVTGTAPNIQNTFVVKTSLIGAGGCEATYLPFMFKVTGRPIPSAPKF